MKLSSPVFDHKGKIPPKYTCEGENSSPPLVIEDLPEGTKSLALVVEDPDAPKRTFVHWVIYDLPVTDRIEENTARGVQGRNDMGLTRYGGPCPPSGTHRYFFKLYALDTELNFASGVEKYELDGSIKGHILAKAELVGLYRKAA
jgi:Raf kinase inhibitor-like YbhB/YbcL family protein